ncbi:MAG: hypothetical protein NPIRA05_01390 [Nitrospirales bacterium]|nr:MAG: hypothetical protein NPIRA05_01390 [Nitrospirales bacterium]
MRRISTLIPLLMSTQIVSAAVDESLLATCAAIEGDLARLEFFDSLARENGLDGPQSLETNTVGLGNWKVDVKINPIDDSTTVTLVLVADSGQSSFNRPIVMVARCRSNDTDFYFDWNDYLGSEANVLTRIGTNEAQTNRWSMSTDSQATFHPRPVQFLNELINADRLVAQITPYNESPVTAIFNLAGISNAIQPLRETCEW